MDRAFARRRLRELLAPVRERADEVANHQPFILDGIRTLALVDGYDVKRERLLHELVAQAGFSTMQLLDDVFEEEDER